MLDFLYIFIALVLVITVHEFAHAYTAYLLGDPTAKREGRVTLNPLAHLDPLGTVLIFLAGIGWGKPVPVNSFNFRKPILYEALVAIAGPAMNLLVALIVLVPLKYFSSSMNPELTMLLFRIFDMSIILFAFNMLPFPPLDGSKFVQLIIPKNLQGHYQYYLANATLYFLAFVLIDNFILARYFNFSVLGFVIGWIAVSVKSLLFWGV